MARARGTLAEGIDDVANSNVSGELATVRNERRALMKRLGWMPVTELTSCAVTSQGTVNGRRHHKPCKS